MHLHTPINKTGYGVVGYNVWKTLRNITNTTLWPIPSANHIQLPVIEKDSIIENLKTDIQKQNNLDCFEPTLKIWHENQLAERIGQGTYVALPFFEVSVFDERRKTHMLSTDHLIVCSEWAKNIVKENGIDVPVSVVECGVDRNIFSPGLNKTNWSTCVFLNCGKWEVRKGHDILHRAFKDAFTNESVELWMMNYNPFLSPTEESYWRSMYSHPKIKIIGQQHTHEDVANVMAGAFCGVFPARSEGWNLEALEMMSMGKEIIITDYSAHSQFCNSENSNLININKTEQMYDGKWFTGDCGEWASLHGDAYDALVESLRAVYKKWENEPDQLNLGGLATAEELSWDRMATKILEIVQ